MNSATVLERKLSDVLMAHPDLTAALMQDYLTRHYRASTNTMLLAVAGFRALCHEYGTLRVAWTLAFLCQQAQERAGEMP